MRAFIVSLLLFSLLLAVTWSCSFFLHDRILHIEETLQKEEGVPHRVWERLLPYIYLTCPHTEVFEAAEAFRSYTDNPTAEGRELLLSALRRVRYVYSAKPSLVL